MNAEINKMPAIIDFFLFWSSKEPNWKKVEEKYGNKATSKLKNEWEVYHHAMRGS